MLKITIPYLNYNCEKIINDYLYCDNVVYFYLDFTNNYPFSTPKIYLDKVDTYFNSLIRDKIEEFKQVINKFWVCGTSVEKILIAFYSHINLL